MIGSLVVLSFCLVTGPEPVEAKLVQVHPQVQEEAAFEKSPKQKRAVVLIHGLAPRLFSDRSVRQAELLSWQRTDSTLVKGLAQEADVFALAYAQTVPVEDVAGAIQLAARLRRLRDLGYEEIVLLGHSAGGLIARHLVEDDPDAGVAKVIQVCTPNGGSSWGRLQAGLRRSQAAFVESLTKEARQELLCQRADRKIPAGVEFICLVGVGLAGGDGVVRCDCQWPGDLQDQGIPALALVTTHVSVMHSKEQVKTILSLVREPCPRWSARTVAEKKPQILGLREAEPRPR